jgi:hypothetical protein
MDQPQPQAQLHRHYLHFSELPTSVRVLYTGALLILGIGYLFALIYLFHTTAGRDGKPGLTYEDVVIVYSGSGKSSRLEAALRGPMSAMLPPEELSKLVGWAQKGADREAYDTDIKRIFEQRCLACHDGGNPHLSNLSSFEGVKKLTEQDTGTDVFTLVRVSHIHMFGMTFIFFLMGLIFGHAYVRPIWLKSTIMALPFLAIAMDVASWYLIKVYHPFALMTMGAGAIMGLSFAIMWVLSMYQIWFSRVPAAVKLRREIERPSAD